LFFTAILSALAATKKPRNGFYATLKIYLPRPPEPDRFLYAQQDSYSATENDFFSVIVSLKAFGWFSLLVGAVLAYFYFWFVYCFFNPFRGCFTKLFVFFIHQ